MILSVILICYNQKEFIVQAIESVLRQKTDFDFELIIGDDCSTDGTSEIIGGYANNSAFVKHFRHSSNLGLIGNFAFCHMQATGKYIATLDGDDYWIDETKLSKQVAMMENGPRIGFVHTQYDSLYMYPKFFGKRYVKNVLSRKIAKNNCSFEGILTEYSVRSSSVCYRRKVIDDSNIIKEFKKQTFTVEDWPIHLQCSLGWQVGYISDSTTVYRINRKSVSHFEDNEQRLEFIQSLLKVKEYFAKQITVDSRMEANWNRSNNMSIAYHYYKEDNYSAYKKVYRQIKRKPLNLHAMFWMLWLKENRLLKSEGIFKF